MHDLLNIILLLSIPFLMTGVIKRVKSFWGGRMGPSVLQPYFDIVKLLCKGEVISGGVFADSPELDRGFFKKHKVDFYLPGCPVHPLTFINGILTLPGK